MSQDEFTGYDINAIQMSADPGDIPMDNEEIITPMMMAEE
jgi:hypothetical protein